MMTQQLAHQQVAQQQHAFQLLQDAYRKLHKKYQLLKMQQGVDMEGSFEEQKERTAVFAAAADALVEDLRRKLQIQEAASQKIVSRSRLLEAAYIECQNDLIIERSKNLELQQDLSKARPHGSNLLHDLLPFLTPFTVSVDGESQVTFLHNGSGFEFQLERNKVSGGKDTLLYRPVALGTLLYLAPGWVREQMEFDKVGVDLFFERILTFLPPDPKHRAGIISQHIQN